MKLKFYREAIHTLYPGARYFFSNPDEQILESLIWDERNTEQVDLELVETKMNELLAAEPMRLLKEERNRRIAATDWRFLSDQTSNSAWIDYRQALRDLPENSTPELDEDGNLINVNWPVEPTE